MHRPGLWPALVILLLPAGAAAQDNAARRAELRARLEALAPKVDSAVAAAERADSIYKLQLMQEKRGSVDTLAVGPFTIITRDKRSARIGKLAGAAWTRFEPLVGSAAKQVGSSTLIIDDETMDEPLSLIWRGSSHHTIDLPDFWTDDMARRLIEQSMGDLLTGKLPDVIRYWLGNADISPEPSYEAVYRQLALAMGSAAKDCRRGIAARCLDALGVADPGPRYERWYTKQEIAAIAYTHLKDAWWAGNHPCVVRRDSEVCYQYMMTRAEGDFLTTSVDAPLGEVSRGSFLSFLLAEKGALAFAPLLVGGDSIGPVLARAADGDLERVAQRWLERVLANRPQSAGTTAASRLITLFWVLVFLGFALRSTKWRLS